MGMGKKNTPKQTQTSSSTIDPKAMEFRNEGYAAASDVANTPFQAYGSGGVAGPTESQTQASDIMSALGIHGNKNFDSVISNLGLAAEELRPRYQAVDMEGKGDFNAPELQNTYQNQNFETNAFQAPEIQQNAMQTTDFSTSYESPAIQKNAMQGMDFSNSYQSPEIQQQAMQTMDFSNTYESPEIQKNAFQGPELNKMTASDYSTAIDARMNPYQDAVVDATMRDIERQRQMQLNTDAAGAVAAGAFGGSRHGLVEAETNRSANQQAIDSIARLRQEGYNTALSSADAEQSRLQGLLLDRSKAAASDTRAGESMALQDASTKAALDQQAQANQLQQNIAAAADVRSGESMSLQDAQTKAALDQEVQANQLQQNIATAADTRAGEGLSLQDASTKASLEQQVQANQLQQNIATAADTRAGEGLQMDAATATAADIRNREAMQMTDAANASDANFQLQQQQLQAETTAAQTAQNKLALQLQQAGMTADDAARAAQMQIQAYQAQGNVIAADDASQQAAIQSMFNMGEGLRNIEQQGLNFDYNEFIRQQNDPYKKLGAYSSMFGAPVSTTTTGATTGPTTSTNPMGAALGGAATGAGTGFMIGGPYGAAIGAGVGAGAGLLSAY